MTRYIYNVWAGSLLSGSFTDERAMLEAIEVYERKYPDQRCHITRVFDGAALDQPFTRIER